MPERSLIKLLPDSERRSSYLINKKEVPESTATVVYLARHGEVANPERILYGRLPGFELSEDGKRQALTLANYFRYKPIGAIFSSPLIRACQTASYIAEMHDLSVQKTDLLNEVKSQYEGWSWSQLEEMNWDVYRDVPGGYEHVEDVLDRCLRFINNVKSRFPAQEIIGVTHGDVIFILSLWLLGHSLDYNSQENLGLYPATGSVLRIVL